MTRPKVHHITTEAINLAAAEKGLERTACILEDTNHVPAAREALGHVQAAISALLGHAAEEQEEGVA